MINKYKSFFELKQKEQYGVDYVIQFRKGPSGILLMAPHGGGIEPGTFDIADSIADGKHSFYCFKGIKKFGNKALHIAAHRFDEPECKKIAAGSSVVVAIHGCSETEPVIVVGGRDKVLKIRLSEALCRMGIVVHENPRPEIKGISSANVCNRGKTGQGVQLEFSRGIRDLMFENLLYEPGKEKTTLFHDMVSTLNNALDTYSLNINPA